MNLLLTSAGRRSYLVDYFRQAWNGLGEVHAANSSIDAAALYHADRYVITPGIYEYNYISFLQDYCRNHRIGVIISLFDIDLPILSQHASAFQSVGTRVIVASPEALNYCNDKWQTAQFLRQLGLNTPRTFIREEEIAAAISCGEITYPIVIKPRWGMGSIGIYMAENPEEFQVFTRKIRREIDKSYLRFESQRTPDEEVLFQEFISGAEFGMDVLNDLKGNHITTLVKKKLAMRSGETDAATTIESEELRHIGAVLGNGLKHPANLDVDVLEKDGIYYVLELNARFGGGYPFSHIAGADFPLAIRHWVEGKTPPESCLKIKIGITGFKTILPEVSPLHKA